jgi:hypothetical protein
MQHYSFGFLSLLFALSFPVLYVVARQFRRFGCWVQREEGPKERVGAMVVILVIVGFGVGSFAQPIWDKGAECKALGKTVAACVFLPQ